MNVVFELTPALVSIYPKLGPRVRVELEDKPLALAEALERAGIQPMLVLKGIMDGKAVELDGLIEEDCEIRLISPLSGG